MSMQTRQRPILEPAEIRRNPLGHGLLLLRSAPAIMLRLSPWTERPDAKDLAGARSTFEAAIMASTGRA